MSKERLVELLGDAPIGVNGITLLDKHEPKVIEEVANYLIANGVIVPPCKVGDEINGEVVHEIDYIECLEIDGTIKRTKTIHTCEKDSSKKIIFVSHPMTWEKAEAKLKGGAEGCLIHITK